MVEYAVAKELPREIEVEPISVITGDNNYKKFLYYQLKMSIRQADAIDIVVSIMGISARCLLAPPRFLAVRNPVKFLKASGRGFFVERDGYPIALAESVACKCSK